MYRKDSRDNLKHIQDEWNKMEEEKKCNCSYECKCGCQDGKECTCNGECKCDENCECGCHDEK